MKTCHECNAFAPDSETFCRKCGKPYTVVVVDTQQPPPSQPKKRVVPTTPTTHPSKPTKHGCFVSTLGCIGLLGILFGLVTLVTSVIPKGPSSTPQAPTPPSKAAVPPRPPQQAPTPRPNLELIDSKWVHEEYASSIQGRVKNNTGKHYSYAQITFSLYDANENLIGTALANIAGLGPYETWKFKAHIFEGKAAKTAKLKDLTGY
jgi:hypothetical protein